MRQRKDNVEVCDRQKLRRARLEPLEACVALALGAVPRSTRVVRDDLIAAAHARIPVATEDCGAAARNGIERLAMRPGKVRSILMPKAVACCADDVGHLESGPAHLLTFFLERFTVSGLETAIPSMGLATACRWRRDRCR